MNITLNIFIFLILGLIVGSFLNVVIFRIDDLKSIINTRSHCQNCKKIIAWYDLIPFSLLLVIFVYDLKTYTVPEILVWTALVISLLFGWYFGGAGILNMIAGGIIAGGFLFMLVYFSPEKNSQNRHSLCAVSDFFHPFNPNIRPDFDQFVLEFIYPLIT